jgi:hypothetical protein
MPCFVLPLFHLILVFEVKEGYIFFFTKLSSNLADNAGN